VEEVIAYKLHGWKLYIGIGSVGLETLIRESRDCFPLVISLRNSVFDHRPIDMITTRQMSPNDFVPDLGNDRSVHCWRNSAPWLVDFAVERSISLLEALVRAAKRGASSGRLRIATAW
jgi:hypothetical protein